MVQLLVTVPSAPTEVSIHTEFTPLGGYVQFNATANVFVSALGTAIVPLAPVAPVAPVAPELPLPPPHAARKARLKKKRWFQKLFYAYS